MQCSLVKKKWGKLHKKRDAIELKVYNFLEVIQLSPTHPTTVTKRRSCNLEREELVLFSKLTHIVCIKILPEFLQFGRSENSSTGGPCEF